MPATINGFGTGYVGKRNIETRRGVCEFCGREADIRSYDTWYCFVVLFVVPVIPLGRRHILNECSSCQQHRAIPLKEWNENREQTIREGMKNISEAPDDPQAALEMFGSLLFFGKKTEAAGLAEIMQQRFAGNADVQMQLGVWHLEEGRGERADEFFARALELDPEHKGARRAAGVGKMQAGELDEARQLLSFMLEPGPDQDLTALVALAGEYQKRDRHREARELFAAVLRENPTLRVDKALRKMVRASEQALPQEERILPRRRFNYKPAAAIAAVLLAIVGLLAGIDWFLRSSQTLYVVNGLRQTVSVRIDGGAEIEVRPDAWVTTKIAEGSHRAELRAARGEVESVEFRVENDLTGRWTRYRTFVLNPWGAAALQLRRVIYCSKPLYSANIVRDSPSNYSVLFGGRFVGLGDVDYKFKPAPQEISMTAGSGQEVRSELTLLPGEPLDVMGRFPGNINASRLMDFAEVHREFNPTDDGLLAVYAALASAGEAGNERSHKFLARGLDRRPVEIEWHRMYQQRCMAPDHYDGMFERYEKMLAAEPESSALLYLRSRLAPGNRESIEYCERAIAADPGNPYAYFGRGYHLLSRGDFAGAKRDFDKALRLRPGRENFRRQLCQARLALGEYAGLTREYADLWRKTPTDPYLHQCYLELLVGGGNRPRAERAQRDHVTHLMQAAAKHNFAIIASGAAELMRRIDMTDVSPEEMEERFAEEMQKKFAAKVRAEEEALGDQAISGRLLLLYFLGENEAVIERSRKLGDAGSRWGWAVAANLALGRREAVERLRAEEEGFQPSSNFALMMSAGWQRAGDAARAEEGYAKAVRAARDGPGGERHIAELLARDADAAEIIDAGLEPAGKAVLLVAVAARRPELRGKLLDLAEKLNFGLFPPHNFIERAIGELRGRAPAP